MAEDEPVLPHARHLNSSSIFVNDEATDEKSRKKKEVPS